MKFKYLFTLILSMVLMTSCAEKSKNDTNDTKENTTTTATPKKDHTKNVTLITSFVEARNAFDIEKLLALTTEDYKEIFNNNIVEVNNQKEFITYLEWAKELSSKTTVKEVISANATNVIVIEESTNYIDVALKKKPQKFITTYYLKDGKITKQNFENAPNETFDAKANDVIYGNFERFCEVRKIPFSWEPTQIDGKILRNALEKYANRVE